MNKSAWDFIYIFTGNLTGLIAYLYLAIILIAILKISDSESDISKRHRKLSLIRALPLEVAVPPAPGVRIYWLQI